MRGSHFIVMVAVLAALITVGLVLRHRKEARNRGREEQLVKIMPEGITADAAHRIKFLLAGDVRVDLVKEGGVWRIANRWNAPAKVKQIRKLLNELAAARGPLVSEDAKLHAEYGVDEAHGVHVQLFVDPTGKPAFDLVLGKNRGNSDSAFVRLAGGTRVYDSGQDLRSLFGLWEDDAKPKYGPWLDKTILALDPTTITRLELTYPDHALVFGLQGRSGGGKEGKAGDRSARARGWRVLSGGPPTTMKLEGFQDYLEGLGSLVARDVVDPSEKAKLQLDKPPLRLTISAGEQKLEVVGVGNPDGMEQAHVMVPGRSDMIYALAPWSLTKLFPKAKDLFDLDPPHIPAKRVRSISIKREQCTIELTRAQEAAPWTLQQPKVGFPLESDAAKAIAEGLGTWQADDFADADGLVKYRLNMPVCRLTAGLADGKTRTLLLGAKHPYLGGSYVAESGAKHVLVMAKDDVKRIFPPMWRLFNLSSVLQVEASAMQSITLSSGGTERFQLERLAPPAPTAAAMGDAKPRTAAAVWHLMAGGKAVRVDQAKAEAYASKLAELAAIDLLFGDQAESLLAKSQVLSIKHRQGETRLEIGGALQDRGRVARASNRPVPLVLKADAVKALLIAAEDLAAGKGREADPAAAERARAKGALLRGDR